MTHGSKNHRAPGSIGAGTTPGRVYPGKKMAGRLGGVQVTIKKLKVLFVDVENNIIIVKGAVPGKMGNLISMQAYTFHN
jgi:large subunit ribosomal protein L3